MPDAAMGRFRKADDGSHFLESGPTSPGPHLVAYVVKINSSWSWTLWVEGRVTAGERSWDMDAYDACERAAVAFDLAVASMTAEGKPA